MEEIAGAVLIGALLLTWGCRGISLSLLAIAEQMEKTREADEDD